MVDNVPLQAQAWAELRAARKRLEKASRDLHRHEQVDTPAFRLWVSQTFPGLIMDIRMLAEQIAATRSRVSLTEREAWFTGRNPASVWQELQRQQRSVDAEASANAGRGASNDEADRDWSGRDGGRRREEPFDETDEDSGFAWEDDEKDFNRSFDRFCAEHGIDPDDPAMEKMRNMVGFMFGFREAKAAADRDAREIYRRLVQRLHPDRGGEWTPERARLWHEVQQAWQQRDADMLARLEVEWESVNEVLDGRSPISRLRAALEEIHSARRDAERKVRIYRRTPEWRFSLRPPGKAFEADVRHDLQSQSRELRAELDDLEERIRSWEAYAPRRKPARRRPRRKATPSSGQAEFGYQFNQP